MWKAFLLVLVAEVLRRPSRDEGLSGVHLKNLKDLILFCFMVFFFVFFVFVLLM